MANARAAGLLAMLVAITAQPLGYNFRDVSRLRAHILNQGSKIDSIVPPPQDVDGVGLPVKMQIRVFKIISVDMPTATMRLQVWYCSFEFCVSSSECMCSLCILCVVVSGVRISLRVNSED